MENKCKKAGERGRMPPLQVRCPSCKRILFHTTDEYDPDQIPHGGMVKLLTNLVRWQIDWETTSRTTAAEMTCPECDVELVVNGQLDVLPPKPEQSEFELAGKAEPITMRRQGVKNAKKTQI